MSDPAFAALLLEHKELLEALKALVAAVGALHTDLSHAYVLNAAYLRACCVIQKAEQVV